VCWLFGERICCPTRGRLIIPAPITFLWAPRRPSRNNHAGPFFFFFGCFCRLRDGSDAIHDSSCRCRGNGSTGRPAPGAEIFFPTPSKQIHLPGGASSGKKVTSNPAITHLLGGDGIFAEPVVPSRLNGGSFARRLLPMSSSITRLASMAPKGAIGLKATLHFGLTFAVAKPSWLFSPKELAE